MKKNILTLGIILLIEFIVWLFFYLGLIIFNTSTINYLFASTIFFLSVLLIVLSLDKNKTEIKLEKIIRKEYLKAFEFSKTFFIVLDKDNKIHWSSSLEFSKKSKNLKIEDSITDFQKILDHPNQETERVIFGKMYLVKYCAETHTILLVENEIANKVIQELKENQTVIGFIKIDHYRDVISSRDQKFAFDLSVIVRNSLEKWAKEYGILLNKISEDTYKFFCYEYSFENIMKDEFSFTNEVKTISDKKLKIFATLSIGVGRDAKSIIELDNLALTSLEKSEKRGGDQATITSLGEEPKYVGGNVEAKTIKSKTKVKNFAWKLEKILNEKRNILISGHKYADYDSISSALAIAAVARATGKTVKVVINFKILDKTTRKHLEEYLGQQYIKKHIISPKAAYKIATKNTLGIIVDTSVTNRIEFPELITICKDIVVIDHHRVGRDVVENMALEHIDPGASSTAEIVIETISFLKKHPKHLSKIEINLLLAGIHVDTNHFRSSRAGSRTFQAVVKLKNWGAEQDVALNLLKEPKEVLELRYEIVKNSSEYLPGILISVIKDERNITNSMIAQGAQTLLEITNTKAAFVIGRTLDKSCIVSARSYGDSFNVQTVMENLGGGGHFSAAATKSKLTTTSHMLRELKKVLKEKDKE